MSFVGAERTFRIVNLRKRTDRLIAGEGEKLLGFPWFQVLVHRVRMERLEIKLRVGYSDCLDID
jgi:hypothetical protein